MNHHSPSEQFISAVDHCRSDFAETKGVTRNAVDQRFAGNTLDPYPPFRAEFKDICATENANPDAYLTDLISIKQKFRPSHSKAVVDAFLSNLGKAHNLIETCTGALSDGGLDKQECRDIEKCINGLMDELSGLKYSIIDQLNVLNGSILPEEIKDKAKLRSVQR